MATLEELAKISSDISGINPEWIKAQWQHETGGMTSPLAKEYNNYGGITQTTPNDLKQPDGSLYYKKFQSPEDFATYFGNYLNKYKEYGVHQAKNVNEYAQALKRGGYFGDTVENYAGGMQRFMGVAGAGGPMGPGTSGMTDQRQSQFQSPQGGDMVQGAFMNFMSQYGNKNQGNFDKSILDDMKEAMKPTQHRQQAMGAFLDSMIMLSEGAKKLRNPDFMKDAYSAMEHINTVNMGFADKMAQEEQQAKRIKVGLSAMGKMAEPGANQSAYGNVFQLATGQKPYEFPDAIGAKDVLGAAIQVGNYNRQNAFLDFQKQKLAEQMDMQKQTFELNKAKMGQKQQPTLTDRKTFLEEIKETKEMLGDPKGQAFKQFVDGEGLDNLVKLGAQVGIPASSIAAYFGVQAKPRG